MIKGINPQLSSFSPFSPSRHLFWSRINPNDNNRMSFGFHRAEVIGALTSVLLIWVVTAILVYMAILRIINRDFEIDATVMLASSAIGILVNVM